MAGCEHSRRIGAYYDGELPPTECRAMEEHLGRCPPCARELERLRRVSELLSTAGAPEISPDALSRLHDNARVIRQGVIARTAAWLTAAAAAILLVCSLSLWRTQAGEGIYDAPAETWETVALAPESDVAASADGEMVFAQWVVEDLSLEKDND